MHKSAVDRRIDSNRRRFCSVGRWSIERLHQAASAGSGRLVRASTKSSWSRFDLEGRAGEVFRHAPVIELGENGSVIPQAEGKALAWAQLWAGNQNPPQTLMQQQRSIEIAL